MLTDNWLTLAGLGGVIIFALAIYAGKLLMQLKQQQAAQAKAEAEILEKLSEHDNKVLSSMVIIVRAMKESQCEFGEGAWRLSVLMDSLKLTNQMSNEYPAISELYTSIKHHAILDERKQLPKQQRMKQDVERMQAEARLTDQINQELELLHKAVLAMQQQLSSPN
ncbi:DUF2489 domain-containing protein [Colwellia sp. MEBiC06753]